MTMICIPWMREIPTYMLWKHKGSLKIANIMHPRRIKWRPG